MTKDELKQICDATIRIIESSDNLDDVFGFSPSYGVVTYGDIVEVLEQMIEEKYKQDNSSLRVKRVEIKDRPKEWKRHCNPLKSELWWECPICKRAQEKRTKYCPDCGQRLVSDGEITSAEVVKMLKTCRK